MKKLIICIGLTCLWSCSSGSQNTESDEFEATEEETAFEEYVNSLTPVPLPFTTHSMEGELPVFSPKFNKEAFAQYKNQYAEAPVGILFKNDASVAIMHYGAGEFGSVPTIVTYDWEGHKLDSLMPYEKSALDLGYEAVEYVTFQDDHTFFVADSVKRWTINEDGSDIVKGTLQLTTDTVWYEIEEGGQIKKINKPSEL
ncbi:hypothetical protein SAMN05421823_106157 [Catalinimonas alkaloidigena]|uniref:Uncharacterized protein n=1 Tax=Catalinimonas alkaloidigena TaxID=1075417 RepID=A0A1G9KGJ3_9BACT|nr:hypothetical protein [Catalinimonas alkaloidigena]SDL48948.1 hypothetical protein SAMN05421823_106157 [Catalinimonas alkaloidigena]